MSETVDKTSILVETQYLPRLSAFVMMQSFSEIIIDSNESFQKSSWRNRTKIVGANGPILLTIPIQGGRGVKKLIQDIRIDNREQWQRIHWGSIFSSYGKSSYFVFYADRLSKFYSEKFEFLIDFNNSLLQTCFDILKWDKKISCNDKPHVNNDTQVFFNGKNSDVKSLLPEYYQVFIEKNGFLDDLSIVDLIFNLGQEASSYLNGGGKSTIKIAPF